MIELIEIGDYKRFNCTGGMQSIQLLPGRYKLECYGAEGSSVFYGTGGLGGYAQGEIDFNLIQMLYVCVGGHYNGYNGGEGSICGGGATHIAKRTGLLRNLYNYKSDILLVAGGGGGGERVYGGHGGGLIGGSGSGEYKYIVRNGGGSQTAGGYGGQTYGYGGNGGFGYGGTGDRHGYNSGPTGGGGWYGGGGILYAGGAGGGSSYISHPDLKNASTQSGVCTGNGYAIITLLDSYFPPRRNSNFYKNQQPQGIFNYEALMKGVL